MLMCYTFTPDSVFKLVLPKTQNRLDKQVCFTHANVLLSYVNESVFAWKPAFLQDSVNHSVVWDISPGAKVISQCKLWVGEGPGAQACLFSFKTFPFSN